MTLALPRFVRFLALPNRICAATVRGFAQTLGLSVALERYPTRLQAAFLLKETHLTY